MSMSGLLLRRLGYLAATALAVSCATYESGPEQGTGGTSSNEAGAPDGMAGTKPSMGGSSAGNSTTGGTKAGTDTGGTDTGGTDTGGTAGSTANGGTNEAGMPAMTDGGTPGDAGAGAGGAPDPGCASASECDDENPCTDDSCVDTVCQHTNNTQPCTDDADDCTDDLCQDGACAHVNNTAPCEDDNDPCTTDVCAGDYCTHKDNGTCQCQRAADCNDSNPCTTDSCVGNQCKYTNNALACATDNNPCTDDVCSAGVCSHPANTDSCTDDGDACTGDVCNAGVCTHPAIAGCCSGDGDCFDNNVCTDDACGVDNKCTYKNNTLGCAADSSPCTKDQCGGGKCSHPSNNVCSGSDNVIIQANRNGRYVVLSGQALMYSGLTPGSAEVFEKVGETGTRFKLRALSTGLYVALGANDALVASANEAGGMIFDAPICGAAPWVGLYATSDANGGAWAAADNGDDILSRSADCGAASATSWEKFQLISVTIPCTKLSDCDDANVCTDDACGMGGFCVYTDHVGTCADDANSCTDDVCTTGTCTHPGNGTCTGPLVTIQANRNGKFVVLNGGYLEYTAASAATAEKFELVDKVGTLLRLRASNLKFVTLDVNDNLIASAEFAASMLFDTPACGANVALVATGDDDANKFIQAAGADRMIAGNGNCNGADLNAWEKWTLVPQ